MHFLIDASLPGSTADVVIAHGHQATDVRDIGMGSASDDAIAEFARQQQFAILSGDLDFGNVQQYPPEDYFGIVVVRPPKKANTAAILAMLESVFNDASVMSALVGRLTIVESNRIRVRPPI